MNQYEIMLKNGKIIIWKCDVVLIDESNPKILRTTPDTFYVNASEVVYIKCSKAE